jgi:hypothetical protein
MIDSAPWSKLLPNHSVEANRRPALPPGAGHQFGSPFSARPDLPAAVAHLLRSVTARLRRSWTR